MGHTLGNSGARCRDEASIRDEDSEGEASGVRGPDNRTWELDNRSWGSSEDRIIVPGSWIIVPARSYRGEEKEFGRKPLAMSLPEGPAVHS